MPTLRSRMSLVALLACLLTLLAWSQSASAYHNSPFSASETINLNIDASLERWTISPYIFGLEYAKESFAKEIDLPVRRWGGNNTTRYNFQNNATNLGSDWYFENAGNWNPLTGTGETYLDWIDENKRTGAESLLTMPTIGYVARDNTSCGFSIQKYGQQMDADPFKPDCGDGIQLDSNPVTNNDPTDTSQSVSVNYVTDWMNALVNQYGNANQGGVRFYDLDNEPELWSETHRDVHPIPQSYDELLSKSIAAASAIKTIDAGAQILGFVSFGWSGYWYSRRDTVAAAANRYTYFPDYATHNNRYQVEFFLDEMSAASQDAGINLMDYLDLHFYPQNGVSLALAGDSTQQALRLRSTRALWDPTYQDESWIGGNDQPEDWRKPRLIPRMHGWVDAHYPGTKLAISEYNWGGLESINGALTQADILGIFAEQRLDLAILFNYPDSGLGYDHFETLPGAFAFRIFRNYDGNKAKFGDTHIQALSANRDKLAVYAAQRSTDGALTILLINKAGSLLTADLSIAGFAPGISAQVYRYSTNDLNAIEHLGDQALNGSNLVLDCPANSLTLLVISNAALLNQKVFLPAIQK